MLADPPWDLNRSYQYLLNDLVSKSATPETFIISTWNDWNEWNEWNEWNDKMNETKVFHSESGCYLFEVVDFLK